VPDASTTTKGLVQLGGDLAGTSAAPTVPGLAAKANSSDVVTLAGTQTVTGAKNFTGGLQSAGAVVVTTGDARLSDTRQTVDGSVTTAKLANGSVTAPKLVVPTAPTTGQVLSYNGTSLAWTAAATGGTGGGDPTLGGDLSGTASAAVINTGAVAANELAANAVTTAKIADLNVTTAKIADAAITEAKLAVGTTPTANQVLTWNGTALVWTTPATGGTGGSAWTATTVTAAYTAVSGNFVIANTSAGGFNVTLPAPANGAYVTVKKLTNDVNAVLVFPPSGQINAGTGTSNSISVNNYGQVSDFIADGTTWHQVG
jgi:hypothetical protein